MPSFMYLHLAQKREVCVFQLKQTRVKPVFSFRAYLIQTPRMYLTCGKTQETPWHSITGGALGLLLSNKLNACTSYTLQGQIKHSSKGRCLFMYSALQPP